MDCLIVMEQFKVKLPESKNKCSDEYKKKNSFESKNLSDFMGKMSGLLHAAPSTL
jgi:hypothetical protein